MNNKPIFVSALSNQFKISGKWRGNNAKRFAHDPRNADAAKRLLDLVSQIYISDDTWTQFAPLLQDDAACLSAISETNRDVGFRTHPADFAAWVENLHSNLTRH
jgi:hypothetical protein